MDKISGKPTSGKKGPFVQCGAQDRTKKSNKDCALAGDSLKLIVKAKNINGLLNGVTEQKRDSVTTTSKKGNKHKVNIRKVDLKEVRKDKDDCNIQNSDSGIPDLGICDSKNASKYNKCSTKNVVKQTKNRTVNLANKLQSKSKPDVLVTDFKEKGGNCKPDKNGLQSDNLIVSDSFLNQNNSKSTIYENKSSKSKSCHNKIKSENSEKQELNLSKLDVTSILNLISKKDPSNFDYNESNSGIEQGISKDEEQKKCDKKFMKSLENLQINDVCTDDNQIALDKPVQDSETVVQTCEIGSDPIEYVQYESELQMSMIIKIIQKDLSEPYSIYTYRYFIHNWPMLCFLAMCKEECVGAIVCKLDIHRKVFRRGYIAMLAVDQDYRKRSIGSTLVRRAIEEMVKGDADEVVLETEITNKPALLLYEKLGFVRDKRLFRYYLNGVDALRLKLWLR